jgi:hypothetical protein
MNKKKIYVSVILLTVLTAAIGTLTLTAFAAAQSTNSTSTDTNSTATTDNSSYTNQPQFGGNNMMMDQGFGRFMGGQNIMGDRSMNNIEMSSEYVANINTILNNDTDVAKIIAEGYNVTAINPDIKTVIQGDGTVTTQATTATVFMQGTSGYATVKVDISNATVTQIVTVTRTVIDKSTS